MSVAYLPNPPYFPNSTPYTVADPVVHDATKRRSPRPQDMRQFLCGSRHGGCVFAAHRNEHPIADDIAANPSQYLLQWQRLERYDRWVAYLDYQTNKMLQPVFVRVQSHTSSFPRVSAQQVIERHTDLRQSSTSRIVIVHGQSRGYVWQGKM